MQTTTHARINNKRVKQSCLGTTNTWYIQQDIKTLHTFKSNKLQWTTLKKHNINMAITMRIVVPEDAIAMLDLNLTYCTSYTTLTTTPPH